MERQQSITFTGIDTHTPVNEPLCAKYTKTFAYHTVKDRLPVILTKVIDQLSRDKEQLKVKYGQDSEEDMKWVIGQISKLKNEVQTNKPLLELESGGDDVDLWNKYLDEVKETEDTPCWFQSRWLYIETYLYRKLHEFFEKTGTLKELDPFHKQKTEAFEGALADLRIVSETTLKVLGNPPNASEGLQEQVVAALKMSLWGNRCDLSLSNGEQVSVEQDSVLSNIAALDSFLLADNSVQVFQALQQSPGLVIDFVFDNAAYELFTDLCLCDVLCTTGLASSVRFHAKKMPWYVSDVTVGDVHWLLKRIEGEEGMSRLAERWKGYFDSKVWTLHEESYWTLPLDYNDMKERDPALFHTLSQAVLVVFKGDLNYRKLLGDINWPHSETIDVALRSFHPTNVLALRTVKADLICGVDQRRTDELTASNPTWMCTGEYGVIQLSQLKL